MATPILTPRQAKFVEAYVLDPVAARAARSAGYSANGAKVTGCRLLTNPNLQAALAARKAELATTLDIDRNAIIGGLFEAIAAAKRKADPGNVIRGWVEVAKLTGLDKPDAAPVRRSDGTGDALRMKLEALPDDVLADIASGRRGVP